MLTHEHDKRTDPHTHEPPTHTYTYARSRTYLLALTILQAQRVPKKHVEEFQGLKFRETLLATRGHLMKMP